jgi:hypothetical protein
MLLSSSSSYGRSSGAKASSHRKESDCSVVFGRNSAVGNLWAFLRPFFRPGGLKRAGFRKTGHCLMEKLRAGLHNLNYEFYAVGLSLSKAIVSLFVLTFQLKI